MKLKLNSNKTLEGEIILPPTPEEQLEEAMKAQTIMLADGPMKEPAFEGQAETEQEPEQKIPYPDILFSQEVADVAEGIELSSLFTERDDFSEIEVEDDEGQTRTFKHCQLCGIQITPVEFRWNLDGKGGLAAPSYKTWLNINLRGLEE